MATDKELYDSLSDDLKADLRIVLLDKTKLLEVAKKHNMTFRAYGQEYAKASILTKLRVVKEFEVL